MSRAPLLFLAAAFAVSACAGEPELEFPDWQFDVPEGTPVLEYAPVAFDDRDPDAVQVIEDLVIGADTSNPAAVLYQATGVLASDDGTMFVRDRGANDIKMFTADGDYIKTLGKEGQGPGEFAAVGTSTIAGDLMLVNDSRNRRYSIWTLDGEHLADHARRVVISAIQGLTDGTFVGYHTDRDEDRNGRRVVTRRTIEGDEIAQLFSTETFPPPTPVPLTEPVAFLQSTLDTLDNEPRVSVDVGAGDRLYLSLLREYQLLAMTPEGEPLWALRVASPRPPYPETGKQPLIDSLARLGIEDLPSINDLDWPEYDNALSSISIDGAGNIYVFPTPTDQASETPELPVDVYSPDGELIAAGIVDTRWSYARGDYVYGIRPNELEETEVVRYRIVINR